MTRLKEGNLVHSQELRIKLVQKDQGYYSGQ